MFPEKSISTCCHHRSSPPMFIAPFKDCVTHFILTLTAFMDKTFRCTNITILKHLEPSSLLFDCSLCTVPDLTSNSSHPIFKLELISKFLICASLRSLGNPLQADLRINHDSKYFPLSWPFIATRTIQHHLLFYKILTHMPSPRSPSFRELLRRPALHFANRTL